MNAIEVMVVMSILRVVLPVALLLMIGEWASRRGHQRYSPR